MADVTPRRAAHELGLPDGERRKVVVQEKRVLALPLVLFDDLCVVGGAERRGDQGLSLASREERRAVRAWEETHLGRDRADLVEAAAVQPLVLVQDRLPRQHLDEVVRGPGEDRK